MKGSGHRTTTHCYERTHSTPLPTGTHNVRILATACRHDTKQYSNKDLEPETRCDGRPLTTRSRDTIQNDVGHRIPLSSIKSTSDDGYIQTTRAVVTGPCCLAVNRRCPQIPTDAGKKSPSALASRPSPAGPSFCFSRVLADYTTSTARARSGGGPDGRASGCTV